MPELPAVVVGAAIHVAARAGVSWIDEPHETAQSATRAGRDAAPLGDLVRPRAKRG